MRLRTVVTALGALLAASGCRLGPDVARISNGRDVSGRFIHPDAYAAFLEGSAAEARGDVTRAIVQYRLTLSEDPDAAEAWARLGAVLCTSERHEADRAFTRAVALAPDLEESHLAAARCWLERAEPARAVAPGERALASAPGDPEATVTLAEALDRSGNSSRARSLRHAFALYRGTPDSVEAPPDALAQALLAADTAAVRKAAGAARLPDAYVAFEALAAGRPAIAARVASLALASDPGDTSARVAALTSADLQRDEPGFLRALGPLPKDRVAPSDRAVDALRDLVARRAGDEAATLVVAPPAESAIAPSLSAPR